MLVIKEYTLTIANSPVSLNIVPLGGRILGAERGSGCTFDEVTMSHDPLTPSHRALCDAMKHRGRATVRELAADLALNVETIREHLRTLTQRELIRRDGTVQRGPGRPEIAYVLTPVAESLFPNRGGAIQRDLGGDLGATGQQKLLRDFFDAYVGARRDAAMARVANLSGRRRLKEVARIFEEMGFMPVLDGPRAAPRLKLCHCPMRDLVHATDIPCRAEIGLLTDLLGTRPTRDGYIPDGDDSCSYRPGGAA
jgi:DeoR family suf operon transcriptional repressor